MSDDSGADYPWDPAEQEKILAEGGEVPPPPEPPAVAAPGPNGGMQAARLGDQTTHFGVIGPAVAAMTVNVENQPAATLGDPQVCPMFDGAKPHTGGAITQGSATVNICGKPAARAGDTTQCTGPSGQVAAGAPTVYIGG
jgi:uncharacterized Zn-binding protein involved in type VI secretion